MAGSAARRISVSSEAMVQQEAPSHEYSDTCAGTNHHSAPASAARQQPAVHRPCPYFMHNLITNFVGALQRTFVALPPALSPVPASSEQ